MFSKELEGVKKCRIDLISYSQRRETSEVSRESVSCLAYRDCCARVADQLSIVAETAGKTLDTEFCTAVTVTPLSAASSATTFGRIAGKAVRRE